MSRKRVTLTIAVGTLVVLGLGAWLLKNTGPDPAARNNGAPQMRAADFYARASIDLIVPTAPGGGFDQYGRLLAPFLARYTGAEVRVLNLPGAGGMRAVNAMSHAVADGRTIVIVNGSGMVSNELAGIEGAAYQSGELEYLGRMVADTRVLTVTAASGLETFRDVLDAGEEIRLGATGLGASGYLDGVISKYVFGLQVRIVHGFDTYPGVRQAMVRGSIAGAWTSWANVLTAFEAGTEAVLLQVGSERLAELADVPTVFELVDETADPELAGRVLSAWHALATVGRPVATTPGTPRDRVRFLRAAFRHAMHDPALLEAARQANRPLHFASGEQVVELIRRANAMDSDIEALFAKAVRGELR